nr:hypothetical protein Itr_chr11CG04790 [Ipomoea trifida]GMD49331.1 hypothetical protein Iba_chr11aCG2680 [Ipomoea batatas]GMD51613.1 hypothetical protein Iba_chr11bCG4000 [Ipomoea batatas]GMD53542.1 hypothetical protein Iba_chr11cCG3620 [Ipomoea batatas]
MAEKKDENRVITPGASSSTPIQSNEEPRRSREYNQREEIRNVLPQMSIHPGIARISQ